MTSNLNERLRESLKFIRNQRQQIAALRDRVNYLERVINSCLGDADNSWLFRNREERMDPTVPIFDNGRAEFHLARYRFACDFVAQKRVADVACGTGYGSRLMRELGNAASVVGIDISAEAVEYARRKHAIDGVSFAQGAAESIPLGDSSVDVVVSFETIEHVQQDLTVVSEFFRILRSGGMLLCSTPNQWPLEIAPHHVREYDRQAFEALLKGFFSRIELFNQNSGTDFQFNRGQPAGIVPTTTDNQDLAECFLAVAHKL